MLKEVSMDQNKTNKLFIELWEEINIFIVNVLKRLFCYISLLQKWNWNNRLKLTESEMKFGVKTPNGYIFITTHFRPVLWRHRASV